MDGTVYRSPMPETIGPYVQRDRVQEPHAGDDRPVRPAVPGGQPADRQGECESDDQRQPGQPDGRPEPAQDLVPVGGEGLPDVVHRPPPCSAAAASTASLRTSAARCSMRPRTREAVTVPAKV